MAMTSSPRPRRAFWADVRFLVGIGLVVLSVTGVWLLVTNADATAPVLQAARTITEGETLTSDDLRVVEVGLGPLSDRYLSPQDLQPGQIAARTLAKGELVPSSASVDADAGRTTVVVVESGTPLPADLSAGSTVDVWAASPIDDGRSFEAPRILVAGAVVRSVVEQEGMLADADVDVELVVDRADVADVLAAITGGSALSVVPVEVAP